MAGISEKLYPPVINGSLPAFYEENGTAKIVVPFSMNRAVNLGDIGGFRLKIKTVQSNTLITTLDNNVEDVSVSIANKKVIFSWSGFDQNHQNSENKKIKIGQYLKVQLAYISSSGIVGYFSTVGIIKYTSKPKIFIENLSEEHTSVYRSSYVGVFEATEDKSERPYSYNFSLFDIDGNLIETTDWLLHNTSINTVSSESLSLERTTDTYSFNTALTPDESYFLQYTIRTINNLEISSPMYIVQEIDVGVPDINLKINAENVFDDGYIKISFELADGVNITDQLEQPVSLEICRAEKTDNFSSWITLTRVYISSYAQAIRTWHFEDFTVEQGIIYKYCFKQYNSAGIQSSRILSQAVMCDFEDMFLCDAEHRQLKIRFNPKMSSFKVTRLETKTDTIGSHYPFIFRNGVVGYKEFPITGLISYLMDDNEFFIKYEDDLHIIKGSNSKRFSTPVNKDIEDTEIGKSWEISETLNSVGYNIRTERRFKLQVLEWLSDGNIKLFRSPTEGNYLIRLMNISLSPEEKLGRMLHNFSSTAYEVEEYSYNNLFNLGFFKMPDSITTDVGIKTVKLRNIMEQNANKTGIYKAFKINQDPIIKYAFLELSPQGTPFYVKIGANSIKITTTGYIGGSMEAASNYYLSDFIFDVACEENIQLIQEINNDNTITVNNVTLNQIAALLQDAQLTYLYENKTVITGEFHNITNAYLQTVVKTYISYGQPFYFNTVENNNAINRTITKFYNMKIRRKTERTITLLDNNYYDENNNLLASNYFDATTVYRIINANTDEISFGCGSLEGELIPCENNTSISLIFEGENQLEDVYFSQEPIVIDLTQKGRLISMTLGDALFAECAYQEKVVEKRQEE